MQADSHHTAGSPPRRLGRRWAIVALLLTGSLLVAAGAQKWLASRQPVAAIDALFESIRDGDRQRYLRLLLPEWRERLEAAGTAEAAWTPEPGLTWRIHRLTVRGNDAEAEVWVEKDGFLVKPRVRLKRSEAHVWHVAAVEPFDVDPRWADLQQARDEELARTLSERLKQRPGITVSRVAAEFPQTE